MSKQTIRMSENIQRKNHAQINTQGFFLHANIKGFSTFIDDETPPPRLSANPGTPKRLQKARFSQLITNNTFYQNINITLILFNASKIFCLK